jgi:WXG100 family type VII secretion target
MSPLTTDPAVLSKEAANFERIAGELKTVIAKVEQVASGLDNHWQGAAAKAAQGAIQRFYEAAADQVRQLNDISNNLAVAGSRYDDTDSEQSGSLASAMQLNGKPSAESSVAVNGGTIKAVDYTTGDGRKIPAPPHPPAVITTNQADKPLPPDPDKHHCDTGEILEHIGEGVGGPLITIGSAGAGIAAAPLGPAEWAATIGGVITGGSTTIAGVEGLEHCEP